MMTVARISWQWVVYLGLVSGFLAFSYLTRDQPGPRPQLAALFLVMFMVVRAIVTKLGRHPRV